MFQRMNHGKMDAQTGLCVAMSELGCLQHAEEDPGRGDESVARERKKRIRSKSGDEFAQEAPRRELQHAQEAPRRGEESAVVVRLGRRLTPYAFASDTVATKQMLERFLEIADVYAPRLAWPTQTDQVTDFADALFAFAQDLRMVTGLVGGRGPMQEYLVKHFVRANLLQVESMLPDAFDTLTMGVISRWVPDQNRHCTVLDMWTGAQVRKRFSLSPLMISCWSCMSDTIGAEHKGKNKEVHEAALQKVLRAPVASLWKPFHEYEQQTAQPLGFADYVFPPGPALIYASLVH